MPEGQIFNVMIAFFEEDDWSFQWMEGLPVLSMGFTGRSGKWMCYAQAREQQEQFVFYSVCPLNAPRERMTAIAEFVTRANYGMIIGNFEVDYADGEIRYKTSIDVEGDRLTSPLVKQMVYANVLIMDRYLPGLMSVIYGNASPIEEIDKIETGLPMSFGEDDELLDGLLEIDDFYDEDDFDDDFDDEDDFDDDDLGDDSDFGILPPGNANLN